MGISIETHRNDAALKLRNLADEWRQDGYPEISMMAYLLFDAFGVANLEMCDALDTIAYILDPNCNAVNRKGFEIV